MLLLIILVAATTFLAYSNGANDNFKGVATVYGCGTLSYRASLAWATITTLAGAVASIFVARLLVDRFSGKGLVPDALTASPEFLLAVAVGAGLTVMIAALLGYPISTTHALTGALVGGGVVAVGADLNIGVLGGAFVLPLLVSPFMAAALSNVGYRGVASIRNAAESRSSVEGASGEHRTAGRSGEDRTARKDVAAAGLRFERTGLKSGGVDIAGGVDLAHLGSAGIVSFARGLNDTPKIVALLLIVEGLQIEYGMGIVALAMAAGGMLHTRRVAEVMSRQITPMTRRQGLVGNLVTGMLVVAASRFGMPVSTTHVSVGSIFGIGTVTGQADFGLVRRILLSWVFTLPAGAALSGATYWLATA